MLVKLFSVVNERFSLYFPGAAMALISQTGSSYCTRTEMFQNKYGQNVVFSRATNIEAYKMKESFIGFSSLSCNSGRKTHILHTDNAGAGQKRHHSVTVAASPPTEDAVIATEPLSKEDLVGYLASGCKPKEAWRYLLSYLTCVKWVALFVFISTWFET